MSRHVHSGGPQEERTSWASSRARSPSSPARHAVRAAATPSGWRRRAPTSSPSTCWSRSGRWGTRWPRRRTWTRPSGWSRPLDRRIVAGKADVRDTAALRRAVDDGVAELGRLDIVLANAGIASFAPVEEMTDEMWDDMIAVNLTGVFKTVRAAVPHLKAGGNGGAIVLTSSTAGIMGLPNLTHYVAAKHGVVGIMKTLALELAPHMIRVNSVHPTSVDTMMIHNEQTYGTFRPDKAPSEVTRDDVGEAFQSLNALPVQWVEPVDISNAILFLVSDDGRYVTGVQLPVDAGSVIK
nr:mycofactocin-coupled SDR family oxidoreductase [Modestobacter excelsi]